MAQKKNSNENNRRNSKKSRRHFGRRRANYVDSFRWGFVESEDQENNREDMSPDDDLYFGEPDELAEPNELGELDSRIVENSPKPVHGKPQPPQKNARETPAVKNNKSKSSTANAGKKRNKKNVPTNCSDNSKTSCPVTVFPLFDGDNDDEDLNLPSYGRTPVPTDEELVQVISSQKTNKKQCTKNHPPKPEIPAKNNMAPVTLASLPAISLKPKKEQMVWDPDKREYVPLIILEKIPEKVLGKISDNVSNKVVNKVSNKTPDKKYIPTVNRQSLPKNESQKKEPSGRELSRKEPASSTESQKINHTKKEPVAVRKKKKHSRNKMKTSGEIPAATQDSCSEKKTETHFPESKNKSDTKKDSEKVKTLQQTGKNSLGSKNLSHKKFNPKDFNPKDFVSKDFGFRNQNEYHEDQYQDVYRPISQQHRGEVQPLIESKIPDPADIEAEVSGFAELGVSETMLEALKIVRYLEPTPIQSGVFKLVKNGADVMGQAQTGTGKTAAFCIPIIETIEECPPGDDPVALILVPTRELAVQVRDEAIRLSYGRDIRLTACYGGKPLAKQIVKLREGIDLIVGTPGRILDLINRRALTLDQLRWVVLDEADRMLDIGFRPDIEKILKRTPLQRQTLLFSATLPPPVIRLAEKYMKSPEILDFSNKNLAVDTIEQFYVTVDSERKFDALLYLLHEQQPNQAIIFTRTKRGADHLAKLLSKQVDSLEAIHGDLVQGERDRVMSQFRAGKLRYLVATDVVGRGIDVSGISHIINYDIPAFCDDYIHRVGRTGRMGREGVAYTFVTVQEGSELTRIEMRIDKLLKRADLKGFESFAKPNDPNITDDQTPVPKPVYGKHVRKIRRAL
ncbi:MAG: DEAD/DEAH box helicase [Planctomycetaceae bacterium]|jgi:ATP-dependent RNA helicase DeaD|nr:DEAD/DEAH box helicase [Planctomycetaceae bacterium]